MEAILILLIISVQFAIGYYSVKYLTDLDNKIIALTEKVEEIKPQITPFFKKARNAFQVINNFIARYYKHKHKIRMYRNLMIIKSLIVMIILYKKRKNIFKFFSVYDIVSKFTTAIMEI